MAMKEFGDAFLRRKGNAAYSFAWHLTDRHGCECHAQSGRDKACEYLPVRSLLPYSWKKPRATTQVRETVVKDRRAFTRKHHEVVRGECRQRDSAAAGERMGVRQYRADALAIQ
jgi:hypothetical protein